MGKLVGVICKKVEHFLNRHGFRSSLLCKMVEHVNLICLSRGEWGVDGQEYW